MRGDILNGLDVSRMASKLAKREQKASEDHRFKVVLSSNDGKTCTIMVGDNQVEADTGVAVYPNDIVTARWRNGRYTVTSNLTKPSVTDSEYAEVKNIAQTANELLNGVAEVAEQADKTLDDIIADAVAANTLLEGVEDVATQADKTLAEIISDAAEAGENAASALRSADEAKQSAVEANGHANDALRQVSIIEDVVDVVSWIAEHSALTEDAEVLPGKKYYRNDGGALVLVPSEEVAETYALTDDESVDQDKTYYARTGSGTEADPYVYEEVEIPSSASLPTYYEKGNPSLLGMYELNEAVRDYLAAHLAMTTDGLMLTADGQKYRALLGTDGLVISNHEGKVVGRHGETIQLGSTDGVYFEASSSKLSFRTLSQEIAYFGLNSNGIWEMHIANTYADDMIRFGDYAWIKRDNGNMSIKWLGA